MASLQASKNPRIRKPDWLKVRLPVGEKYRSIKDKVQNRSLNTVCQEANCPNIGECWQGGTATFMLLGEICTRGCRFCNVKSGNPNGIVDDAEPEKVAQSILEMDLTYVVLTTVDRDDLADSGAAHFAKTVNAIRKVSPKTLIETLVGDFAGNEQSMATMLASKPEVYAHNIETVQRLTPTVRDKRASYAQSLSVLATAKGIAPNIYTKSSIMLGLGETENEVEQAMKDLREVDCDALTLGQYLQPSSKHMAVSEYIHPDQFKAYRLMGESLGFAFVASAPLVRSSYRAGEYFIEHQLRLGKSKQ